MVKKINQEVKERIECSDCDYVTDYHSNMNKHGLTHRKKPEQRKPKLAKNGDITCKLCVPPMIRANYRQLRMHLTAIHAHRSFAAIK
jgi:hypothetical protein